MVNVDELKTNLIKYNSLIENYQSIYDNLYNEISSASFFWNDEHASSFFENINVEKIKVGNVISELNSVKNVYSYIVSNYEKIGNKIVFDLDLRNEIMEKFDNYINKIIKIIKYYDSLDLSFCVQESKFITSEKNKLVVMKNVVFNLKEKIMKIFDDIEEIEKQVNLMISKINIGVIKESEIDNFI